MRKPTDLADVMRKAMKRDGRSIYAFARDSRVGLARVQDFMAGGSLRLDNASKLCDVLGLTLRPRKGR